MRVRVLFFGVMKELVGRAEDSLEIAAGTTIEDVFAVYSERFETLRNRRPSILFARNREFAKPGTVLEDRTKWRFCRR